MHIKLLFEKYQDCKVKGESWTRRVRKMKEGTHGKLRQCLRESLKLRLVFNGAIWIFAYMSWVLGL